MTAVARAAIASPITANSNVISSLTDFAPEGVERGVGLALQDDQRRYVFFLAGTRHQCPPGECFYAGIGGHVEIGQSWLDCAQREAREEIGTEVRVVSASQTYWVTQDGSVQQVNLTDEPRPLALYEMIHQADAPRAGELYRIVIYRAQLTDIPSDLPPDEVQGIVGLTAEQVKHSLERKPTLSELLEEGAEIIASASDISGMTRLYPIGTARALAQMMQHMGGDI